MLARFVRLALALEMAAYAALGAWLHARGLSLAAVVVLALIVATGMRLGFVIATLLLAGAFAPRPPAAERIGALAWSCLAAGEFRAVLLNNFLYLPFEPWVTPREPEPRRAETIPVVLVHGYFSSRGYFEPLLGFLEARGVAPVFAPNFPGFLATIEGFTAELAAHIERVVEATGQPRVVLVCHSMGGIAARLYLAEHGAERVASLVTIASPHAGTLLARLAPGANARQMERGSAFLAALAAREAGRAPCDATSIYSPHDNLVWPHETSRLAWARNVALPGLGHVSILAAPSLHRILLDVIQRARTGATRGYSSASTSSA